MRTLSRLSHPPDNLLEGHAGGGRETRHPSGFAVHGCGRQILKHRGVGLEFPLLGQPRRKPTHLPGSERDVSDAKLRAELPESLVFGGSRLDGGVGVGQRLEVVGLHIQIVPKT